MQRIPNRIFHVKTLIRFLALLCCMQSCVLVAQTPLPLGDSAPAGNVLRAGHLGRQIGDIERIIHFYHDLLGMEISGERNAPRPFFTTPGLAEFANTPSYADFRAVILPIPGTAAEAGKGQEMTVEAIEFRNMDRHQWIQGIQDIGSSHLVLLLRDLDKALGRLKAEGVVIVTTGGEPVETQSSYGGGTERSLIVRDPDGYPVQLTELKQAPKTTAPADSNIIGARISVTVENLEASEKLYTTLVGPELKFSNSAGFVKNEAYNRLRNTPNAEYRYGAALIPGSPVYLEFVQYRGIEQKKNSPILHDIGGAHVLFMARDIDVVMSRMNAAGMKTVATSGRPVLIGPTAPALFSKDINNFFFEFIASAPAKAKAK
jgi:catechol 2,3-dioxygenase-like lactoylglutathione lyase family enzyme